MLEGAEITREVEGDVGLLLYMAFRSVLLWSETAPAAREGLFSPTAASTRGDLLDRVTLDQEIAPAVGTLGELLERPTKLTPTVIAYACWRISSWAAGRQWTETAAAFARAAEAASPEMVARLQSEPPGAGESARSEEG